MAVTTAGDPGGEALGSHHEASGAEVFAALYNAHGDFVFRSLLRLGVAEAHVEDKLQDVFVVVHRRLGEFEGRSTAKTWIFGILLRVAHDYRRTARRKPSEGEGAPVDPDTLEDLTRRGPHEQVVRAEELRQLDRLLDELDDEKRAVFVLAELEQMPAPEIAAALGVKLNTVYSRLRAARQAFEQAVGRYQLQERRRA